MATNKVVYGNNTLIDLTSDTATPSDVASGVTFHDRSGVAQTGSYVAPTITDITPSNAMPVFMYRSQNYSPTDYGYAIEDYSRVTPADTSTPLLLSGKVYLPSSSGFLYKSNFYGVKYTKFGTMSDFTTANQEDTVYTGLSEVIYFYIEATPKNYSNLRHRAWLNMNATLPKQVAVQTNSTAATVTATSSGTDANGLITANGSFIKVSAISGGTVTIKTANNINYVSTNVRWYAG